MILVSLLFLILLAIRFEASEPSDLLLGKSAAEAVASDDPEKLSGLIGGRALSRVSIIEPGVGTLPLLHYAVLADSPKVVAWYVEKGGDILIEGPYGNLPGEIALRNRSWNLCSLLKRDERDFSDVFLIEFFSRTYKTSISQDQPAPTGGKLQWEHVPNRENQVHAELKIFEDEVLTTVVDCYVESAYGYYCCRGVAVKSF